jgi:hypothetical protein
MVCRHCGLEVTLFNGIPICSGCDFQPYVCHCNVPVDRLPAGIFKCPDSPDIQHGLRLFDETAPV